jgi:hypothetical protein
MSLAFPRRWGNQAALAAILAPPPRNWQSPNELDMNINMDRLESNESGPQNPAPNAHPAA